MNELTESEQAELDRLVKQHDHCLASIQDIMLLKSLNEAHILSLLRERGKPLNGAWTSDRRCINFDGDIVRIDKHPRRIYER